MVAWLFARFVTVLRIQPGDILIVYDRKLLQELTNRRHYGFFPFNVPLINGEGYSGMEDTLLMKEINFKELTAIYQIALKAHQEAECERIQNAVSSS